MLDSSKGTIAAHKSRDRLSAVFARAVPLGFLAILLGLPIFWILLLSLGYPKFNFDAYFAIFESGVHLRIARQTLAMAALATVAALLLGYPVAYVMASFSGRWLFVALCVVSFPLWTSLLVRTYAWIVILSPNGPINQLLRMFTPAGAPFELTYNRFGAVVGLTHSVMPYLILPIYAAIKKVDPKVVRAAESLGASPYSVFAKVILPLTLPGVIAGCLFAFLLGLGAFVIPALLGGASERTIGMMIEDTANQALNWNLAAALAIELLIATILLLVVCHATIGLQSIFGGEPSYRRWARLSRPVSRFFRRLKSSLSGGSSAARSRQRARGVAGAWHLILMKAVAGFTFLFIAAPVLIVIPLSFSSEQYLRFPPPGFSLQWYERYLGNPQWLSATRLSVVIALAVVVVTLVIGILAAFSSRRMSGISRSLLTIGCVSPMIIPNMVLALGFFFAFSQMKLVGNWIGLVLAHSVLALPLVFITIDAALREIDPALERAANILGATPFQTFLKIVLPLLKVSILTASLFAFIISFDEIVVALFLTSVSVRTLPKMIWENITMFMDPTVSAVSVILLLASIAFMVTAQVASRTRGNAPRQTE